MFFTKVSLHPTWSKLQNLPNERDLICLVLWMKICSFSSKIPEPQIDMIWTFRLQSKSVSSLPSCSLARCIPDEYSSETESTHYF